jgi:hypothetical protein
VVLVSHYRVLLKVFLLAKKRLVSEESTPSQGYPKLNVLGFGASDTLVCTLWACENNHRLTFRVWPPQQAQNYFWRFCLARLVVAAGMASEVIFASETLDRAHLR